MFFGDGEVFNAIPCRRPDGYSLIIVPQRGHLHGPLGRCGHTILDRHNLILQNGIGVPIEVVDTAAMEERRRDENGIRRHGPIGAWFGLSPHRCDACKRTRELENTIVCPCCRRTIQRGDNVSLIATPIVDQYTEHDDLRPFFVTTEDDALTVVCEACGTDRFNDQDEPSAMWVGEAVVTYTHHAAMAF